MYYIRVLMLLGLTVAPIISMQTPPESKRPKRLLFEEDVKDVPSVRPSESPSKKLSGYGTASDTGTPAKVKKMKADMGIHKVNILNVSGKPALVAFQGSAGKMYEVLEDFNTANNKAKSQISTEINLLRDALYITAIPELFRISVNSDKKRLDIAKVASSLEAMNVQKDRFVFIGDLPYQASGVITIKVVHTGELAEPVSLNIKYE